MNDSTPATPDTVASGSDGEPVVDLTEPVCREPLAAQLEALLMVAEAGLSASELATFAQAPIADVVAELDRLVVEYAESGRGFELRQVTGRWRFYSSHACAPVVERFAQDDRVTKLSQAALETLAVVAYKQPVSRARISAIRGVSVDGVIRTLLSRELIAETGTDPSTSAVLYGTTDYFLERLGIDSVAELPPIVEYLPEMAELDELAEQGR